MPVSAEPAHSATAVSGGGQVRLTVVPLELADANHLVAQWHRHHAPVRRAKFAIGVADPAGNVRGCAIVGRPLATAYADGWTLEVVRVATDGCDNACSALYAAAWRTARAMGYRRIGTYTLVTEPGTSLRAAGWVVLHQTRSHPWDHPSRPRVDVHPTLDKFYWRPADCGGVRP